MPAEKNKALVRRFFDEVLNNGNIELAEEIFKERPQFPLIPWYRSGFSDSHVMVDDMVSESDKVMVRCTFEGTHDKWFSGQKPTGRKVVMNGVYSFRIEDDKLLQEQGFPAYLQEAENDGKKIYRLLVGPEVHREKAVQLQITLAKVAKLEGIVVKAGS